uniref:Ubiquitin-like domain-containing protein n=1 Tax=Hyaloperonospora arabidopsidis (strain Emoy2) TaxID=559515 RepID=M4BFP1_HYAAE
MDSSDATPSSPVALQDEWTLVNNDAEIVALVQSKAKFEDQGVEAPSHEVPEGFIPIRLRQGETIRVAWFKATQRVNDFVAKFFAEELTKCRKIRLIYMGMLLLPTRTMGEYGIEENGVIHSVITDAPPGPHLQAALPANLMNWKPQSSLLVLTGVFLSGLWTLMVYFPHLFSWTSTVLLLLFSVMHISAAASGITI